jgi:hypothetical protein
MKSGRKVLAGQYYVRGAKFDVSTECSKHLGRGAEFRERHEIRTFWKETCSDGKVAQLMEIGF